MSPRIWIPLLQLAVFASPAMAATPSEAPAREAPKICKLARLWGAPDKPRRICLTQTQWDQAIVSEADMPSYRAGLRNEMTVGNYPTATLVALQGR